MAQRFQLISTSADPIQRLLYCLIPAVRNRLEERTAPFQPGRKIKRQILPD